MKVKILHIGLFIILLLLINSCINKKRIIAEKGVIDLKDWDFEKNGIIRLDGEWEFFNNELLNPIELKEKSTSDVFVLMPGRWRNIKDKKIKIDRYGFVTYRMKVLLNKRRVSDLSLRIPTAYVAYTIWIDNKYKFMHGKVAKNIVKEIPRSYPKQYNFNAENNEIEIIIQNSNFHDESGGFLNSFILGTSKQIQKYTNNNLAVDLFLFGAILLFSLYNIILFLFHKKDISPLIFSIICLVVSIRILLVNECFLYSIFSNFNFELARKLEYLTICIGPSLYVYFIYKQFSNYMIKKIVIISQIIGFLFFFIIIFTPVRVYSYILIYIQLTMVFDFCYVLYVFFRAMFKKEIEAIISFICCLIVILTIIYEILYHYQFFFIGIFAPMGLVIYIFGQSFILSLRFAKAYSKLEYISNELKMHSEELEKKVIERTKKLEDANSQKVNFFVNFAHEIKTPLTLISNYLDKYIKKVGFFSETMIIKDNLDKLRRDMVNILDVEKLTKGQIYYDHSMIINLSSNINKKILFFKEIANNKKIKISEIIQKNIYIKIDEFALDRILNNLLDNAIKYNKQNGEIKVILKANKSIIKLIISDTGIGIEKEKQIYIYDPYYQLSHYKRNVQGIGIGLSIVKRIIDQINGEMSIKSILGEGTEFTLKFKRYYIKRNDSIKEDYTISKPIKYLSNIQLFDSEYKKNKYNIFIVEDNIELLILLKESIIEKYNFYYAMNGKEALEKIINIPKPDIIISDIMMDEMDGYTFFENIYNSDEYKSIPFIFLTAKSMEEDRIKGLSKGAIDFISKPFSIDELIVKIESIINYLKKNEEVIQKKVSNELFNYLKEEFSTTKKLQYNKKSKVDYDIIGKLYSDYRITKKENEIINLLIQGLEYKEIGSSLNISINTVRTYIKRVFKKCSVNSTKELLDLLNKINNSLI